MNKYNNMLSSIIYVVTPKLLGIEKQTGKIGAGKSSTSSTSISKQGEQRASSCREFEDETIYNDLANIFHIN